MELVQLILNFFTILFKIFFYLIPKTDDFVAEH